MFSTLSFLITLTFFLVAIAFNFLNCCYLTQSLPDVTVTMMTTATRIDAPYIHPCYQPYVATPKIKDTIDATHKILNMSSSKLATIYLYSQLPSAIKFFMVWKQVHLFRIWLFFDFSLQLSLRVPSTCQDMYLNISFERLEDAVGASPLTHAIE